MRGGVLMTACSIGDMIMVLPSCCYDRYVNIAACCVVFSGWQASPGDVRSGLRALNKGSFVGAFQAALLSLAVTCGRRGPTVVAVKMRDVVWTITSTAIDDSGRHVQHASMAITFSMEKCMDVQGKRQLLLDSTGNPLVVMEFEVDPAVLCLNWAVQMGAVSLASLDSCCTGDVVPHVPGTEDWWVE